MFFTTKRCWLLISNCLLFVLPGIILAEPSSDFFKQGIAESKQNRPEQAIKAFKAAQAAGMDSPVLQYNLGVSYFQLGRFKEAEKAFSILVDIPRYAPLASYNLGLVALKNDDTKKATQLFRRSLKTTHDPALRILSKKALKRLGVIVKDKKAGKRGRGKDWRSLLDVSITNDSNVNLDNRDTLLLGSEANRDTVTRVLAKATTYISGKPKAGIRFDISTDIVQNQTLSNRDFSSIQLSLGKEVAAKNWPYYLRWVYQQNRFAGNRYSRLIGIETAAEHRFNATSKLKLRYRYVARKALDPAFRYIDGDRNQLRARLYLGKKKYRWRFEYKYQVDDSADLRSTRTQFFRSYSKQRNTFRVTKYFPISGNYAGNIDIERRDSKYADNDVLANGTTYLRQENRTRATLEIRYMAAKRWDLYLKMRHTDNVSNRLDDRTRLETFSFERTQISLGSTWDF